MIFLLQLPFKVYTSCAIDVYYSLLLLTDYQQPYKVLCEMQAPPLWIQGSKDADY